MPKTATHRSARSPTLYSLTYPGSFENGERMKIYGLTKINYIEDTENYTEKG
jgi:hypothetical protein